MRILIVGFSTRAIAESAARGRYNVVTLDYFGDRDQKELVENYSLMRDFQTGFSAKALLIASHSLNFQAVAYTSSLENHPDVIEKLAQEHTLLGNSPSTLRRARDWGHLRFICRQENVAHPDTLLPGEEDQARGSGRWVSKPVRSGGGHGIGFWRGGALDKGRILQKWIEGKACSAAFVADGRRCVLLGLTEQLTGRAELGARGFTWCGNILPLSLPAPEMGTVIESVREMAEKLTRACDLRGVNGVDFVLGRDEAVRPLTMPLDPSTALRAGFAQDKLRTGPVSYLVEVNPRYTASMELVEWAYGLNVFDLHVRSFDGDLPSFLLRENVHRPGFYGKGIVYAGRDVVLPETARWREKSRRDIPFPGERIEAGHPICTVLAQGRSRDECWSRLLMAAEMVWREVDESVANEGADDHV